MLDTMNAYGALNYGESDIPKDILEQKYAVANAAEAASAQSSSAPPEIDLVSWFQKAGYMPYVSGDVTFRDIVAQWKPRDWDQLIGHMSDTQILKDAPPQEQARFKDYLYALREQAATLPQSAPAAAPQAEAAPAPAPAPKRGQQTTSLVQSKGILGKFIPMPIVQLGLAGAGYYAGKYFDSPYIGAGLGAAIIPLWQSRTAPAVYHLRGLYGSMTHSPTTECPPGSDCKVQPESKSPLLKSIPIGLGTIAMALSYSRNQSILKSIGAGFIAPIYLVYVGIDYAKKKMK